MFHEEAFFELRALITELSELSDEEAFNEVLRRLKEKDANWFRLLQPLLVFAGRRGKRCAEDIRASLAITEEDERLLGTLPSDYVSKTSVFATPHVYGGIMEDDPSALRTLFLCVCIARRVLNATD